MQSTSNIQLEQNYSDCLIAAAAARSPAKPIRVNPSRALSPAISPGNSMVTVSIPVLGPQEVRQRRNVRARKKAENGFLVLLRKYHEIIARRPKNAEQLMIAICAAARNRVDSALHRFEHPEEIGLSTRMLDGRFWMVLRVGFNATELTWDWNPMNDEVWAWWRSLDMEAQMAQHRSACATRRLEGSTVKRVPMPHDEKQILRKW